MAILLCAECDGCRFVPETPAIPSHSGKLDGRIVRERMKEMGWQVTKAKDGWWRFYCVECQADIGRERKS